MKKSIFVVTSVWIVFNLIIFTSFFANAADTIQLKFAQPFPKKHTMQAKVFEPWAEKMNQLTNGKVKIIMYPGETLGKAVSHYHLAEIGKADIAYALHDYTPGRFQLTSVFELPFVITTAEKTSTAMWKTFQSFPEFQEEYRDVKVLALFCHPGGQLNTIAKPVKSLNDLNRMKLRTANPYVTKALIFYGAFPVNLPITETYLALKKGRIEGTVLPWEGNHIFKLSKLLRYVNEINFYTMTMMVVMNKRKWESLPADVKNVFEETTGRAMSTQAGRVYDKARPIMKEHCQKDGMTVITLPDDEKEKLKTISMILRKEWVNEMEHKGFPGENILRTVIRYVNE